MASIIIEGLIKREREVMTVLVIWDVLYTVDSGKTSSVYDFEVRC